MFKFQIEEASCAYDQSISLQSAIEGRATVQENMQMPVPLNISIQLKDLAKELCHEARCRARAEARAEEMYHINTMMQARTMVSNSFHAGNVHRLYLGCKKTESSV